MNTPAMPLPPTISLINCHFFTQSCSLNIHISSSAMCLYQYNKFPHQRHTGKNFYIKRVIKYCSTYVHYYLRTEYIWLRLYAEYMTS